MKTAKKKSTHKKQSASRGSVKKTTGQIHKTKRNYNRVKFTEEEGYIKVPKKAMAIFLEAIEKLAEGKGVNLVSSDEELSTEQAAAILHVSRPFIVKLLETGKIPFKKIGTHRRILRGDLDAYHKKMKITQEVQLEFLTKQAQDLSLGYN